MKYIALPLLAFVFAFPAWAQSDIESILPNARSLERNNNFAEAAAEMSKAIALEPKNTHYLFEQAQYYERAKDETNFLKDIDQALILEPDNETTVMDAARYLFQDANPTHCERSLVIVNEFLLKHPQSDKAYSARFFIKQCLDDQAGAFNDISAAIELKPEYALYQANRANLISRMGDSKLALQLLQTLITTLEAKLSHVTDRSEVDPIKRDLGMSLHQVSIVYERGGDKKLAIEALTEAIRYGPDARYGPNIYVRERALAYSRFGMYNEAITEFTQAIADQEELVAKYKYVLPNVRLYLERGDTFYAAGEYTKALDDYRECLRLDDRNKALYEKHIDRVNQKLGSSN
jgi:tetratricopeptide (TPR) repeat protein